MKKTQHLEQARHNERFLDFLLADDELVFSDWAAAAIFYTALHYIDAYLSHRGVDSIAAHYERNSLVKQHCSKELYAAYRKLLDESRLSRYEAKRFTRSQIEGLRRGSLTFVRDYCLTSLK